ncbi:MAG: valine--tRNA ligase, partial [SAR202 cluster bacterium]|nr:valine--tRNA ligase [SAR202 cluster bacterium]
TLLGDTAVAVNPEDIRYSKLAGKNAILPITGRLLPIIKDDSVDLDFGTGALKVTPGHDATDFEIGERHGLEVINIINPNGTLNQNAGVFQDLSIKKAREKVVNQLDQDGLLVNIEPLMHSVGKCERSGDTIEPIVSSQWFVKTEQLAKPAIEAVKTGEIEIIPKRFEKVYFNWMENIKDWCVSRQLWWGHQIPVWYCANCDGVIVNTDEPNSCVKCGDSNLTRDPDVLDTWFSSGLWTHSTLGWPENTEDLSKYYPGSVMETGYDILFFWVARMIMMGIYNNNGQVPFKTVYLHGLVLDPEGSKMSKTKGNVLDPLDIIDQYGADAMRFALTTGNSPGQNIRLNEQKLEAGRNFANKIWNSSRFVMMKMDESKNNNNWLSTPDIQHPQDKWILSRLNATTEKVNSRMKNFQFGEAQLITHDFIWNEYCDWYIEMAKVRLRDNDMDPINILPYVLEKTMRLLHPFMPFLTETIWQNLTKKLPESTYAELASNTPALIIASYPEVDSSLFDKKAEQDVNSVIEIVKAIRNFRSEFRIKPSTKINVKVQTKSNTKMLSQQSETIKNLAFVKSLIIEQPGEVEPNEASLILDQSTVVISLSGLVDIETEKRRLGEELKEHNRNETQTRGKLNNKQFTSKAPEEVIQREEEKLNKILERKERLNEIIRQLS